LLLILQLRQNSNEKPCEFWWSLDQKDRYRLFAEVQRIWSENLPEINLVSPREAVAYKSKFGNIHASPLPPRATWHCEEIYIKK